MALPNYRLLHQLSVIVIVKDADLLPFLKTTHLDKRAFKLIPIVLLGIVNERNKTVFLITKPTVSTAIHLQQQSRRFHSLSALSYSRASTLGSFNMVYLVSPTPKGLAFDTNRMTPFKYFAQVR